jgi:hypothetical protein
VNELEIEETTQAALLPPLLSFSRFSSPLFSNFATASTVTVSFNLNQRGSQLPP